MCSTFTSRSEILSKILDQLAEKSMRFLVLRNYQRYPNYITGDVDLLLVDRQRIAECATLIDRIVTQSGWRIVQVIRRPYIYSFTAVNLSSPELMLVIDVFLSLSWLTFEYIDSEAVYGRRKGWDGFSVPHSVDAAFITCVHYLLWSAFIPKKYRADIHDTAVGDPQQFLKYLQNAFGGSLGKEVHLLIAREHWDALEKRHAKYIVGLLAKRPFIRIASESIRLCLCIMRWRPRPVRGLLLVDYCDSAESRELISTIQAKVAALHLFRGVESSDSRMTVASRPGGLREFVAIKWLVRRGYCVALPGLQGVRKTLLNMTPRVVIGRRDSWFYATAITAKSTVRHILPRDLNALITTIVSNSIDNISPL